MYLYTHKKKDKQEKKERRRGCFVKRLATKIEAD